MIIYPVIHYFNDEVAMRNAETAFEAGCDGVFLIQMQGYDGQIIKSSRDIQARFSNKMVGVNFLACSPGQAFLFGVELEYDMVWSDAPGITSAMVAEDAKAIAEFIRDPYTLPSNLAGQQLPKFFASVAFKYQEPEEEPSVAAIIAQSLGFIPTTSGIETGVPAPWQKVATMRRCLDTYNRLHVSKTTLALASGLTPENIELYAPFITHALVSTGISTDFYNFSKEKLIAFVENSK